MLKSILNCFVLILTIMGFIQQSLYADPLKDTKVIDLSKSPGNGYISLFNGSGFTGWDITPDEGAWIVEDRVMRCKGKPGNPYLIRTVKEFENFDFYAEFKASENCNSGIFFHIPMKGAGRESRLGFETQIDYSQPPGTKTSTGAIYDVVAPLADMAKPAGQWNQYHVIFDWPVCKVWLNGILVQDTDFRQYPKLKFRLRNGAIGLSNHGFPIDYRNIWIKELHTKEESKILFNGVDLNGWTSVGNSDWHVEDGSIVSTKGEGWLVTNEPFADYHFIAYVENDMKAHKRGCFYYRWTSQKDPGYRVDFFDYILAKETTAKYNGKLPETVSALWTYEWLPYQIISTDREAQIRVGGDVTTTHQLLNKVGQGKIAIYHHPDDGILRIKTVKISTLNEPGI
jgi:hypothetical protein